MPTTRQAAFTKDQIGDTALREALVADLRAVQEEAEAHVLEDRAIDVAFDMIDPLQDVLDAIDKRGDLDQIKTAALIIKSADWLSEDYSTGTKITVRRAGADTYEADIRRFSNRENEEYLLIDTKDHDLKAWLKDEHGFETHTKYLRKDRKKL